MTHPLLLDLADFAVEQITLVDERITVRAHSQATSGLCPDCGHLSSRIHSHYQRKLADLPWSEYSVRLVVQVHRFFCTHASCARKTFAEALPTLAERFARRTIRLKKVLERLGLALGGEAAARLSVVLGMCSSPDALLRLLRRFPDEPVEPPRVVSLDDWAWRKGHRYGTLICDLERHRRLDVLPDRDAASAAAWLRRYPSIEIISRDRSDTYATAAKQGAPQAMQVTDKWHLLKNLGEALQRCLSPHLTAHQRQQTKELLEASPVLPGKHVPRLSPQQEQVVQLHRAERVARYEQAMALRKQGLSYQAIAERVGVGHSTVRRWIEAGVFPERKRREQASQLDPYLSFIRERWAQGCHNMARIYRELTTKGYKGSYESVRNLVISLRSGDRHAPLHSGTPISSRQATWLFLHRPEKLTRDEQQTLAHLRNLDPEVDLAYELVQQFVAMMRDRTGAEQLDGWLETVASSPLTALHPFIKGVYQDKAAVQAGLTLAWSQGQTEGQITRLKLIKRQGYGRAKFDLLRQRVLHAA
ncbi:transposase [Reticulibacter mediterranei]|uniref:Transposase n=1 Tax=Reticulibacter mediterranei TaxID=2778369 RepID=A0A8J3N6H6_9CHLR|nr:ISL3 family transposase [Reticulibacter mediterranei]GHO97568.1 transposase [Reticulibacter mediterranei]